MIGYFFFQNVIIFSNVIPYKCNILAWNWSNTMNIFSALWLLMVWCFSTRASVATLLSMHPSISSCVAVNKWQSSTVDLQWSAYICSTNAANCNTNNKYMSTLHKTGIIWALMHLISPVCSKASSGWQQYRHQNSDLLALWVRNLAMKAMVCLHKGQKYILLMMLSWMYIISFWSLLWYKFIYVTIPIHFSPDLELLRNHYYQWLSFLSWF